MKTTIEVDLIAGDGSIFAPGEAERLVGKKVVDGWTVLSAKPTKPGLIEIMLESELPDDFASALNMITIEMPELPAAKHNVFENGSSPEDN